MAATATGSVRPGRSRWVTEPGYRLAGGSGSPTESMNHQAE